MKLKKRVVPIIMAVLMAVALLPMSTGVVYADMEVELSDNPAAELTEEYAESPLNLKEYAETPLEFSKDADSSEELLDEVPEIALAEDPETIRIGSAEDWETFCTKVSNAQGAPVNAELTCDVKLTEESSMAGATAEFPFTGVFDGKGYTLTVNYVNNGRTAPFKHIGGGGVIQNLRTAGTITLTSNSNDARHSSGVVGGVEGIATIRGCTCSVDIRLASGSSSIYSGGFVGHAGYCENLTIEDCVFDGSFGYVDGASYKPGLHYISGFVAWGDNFNLTIRNCVNKGKVSDVSGYYPIAYTSGGRTVENCLYYYPGITCNGVGTMAVAVSGKDSTAVEVTDEPAMVVDDVKYYTSPIHVNLTPEIPEGTEFWKYTINTGSLSDIETMEGAHQITGFNQNVVIGRKVKNVENTIIIRNTDDWEAFCRLVNNAGGETAVNVELAADISLNETSSLAGNSNENPFVGTFDGKGHTLHLQFVRRKPFNQVADAVIKNLNTDGTVTVDYSDNKAYHQSGLVGSCFGDVEIVNCVVGVNFLFPSGTVRVYSGGFVGHGGSANIKMNGCKFTGSFGYVEDAASKPGLQNVGGLIGWGDNMRVEMSDCRNLGTFHDVAQLSPLVRGGTSSCSVKDSYYIGTLIPNNGEYPHDNGIAMVTVKSDEGVLLTINDSPFYTAEGIDYYVAPISVTLKPILPEGTMLENYIVNNGEISDPGNAEGTHELTGCIQPITISRTVRSVSPNYLISSADDWAAFCEEVNEGTGDKVLWAELKQDVTLTPDSPTAGTNQHPFTGIFDGKKYTLTVNYESADKRAPFQKVSGGAIIKNLRTAGTITMTGNTSSSWHVSGLIGSTPGEVTIQDCTSSVDMRFPSEATKIYAAGFIGHSNSSTVNMNGCVFDGSIGYVEGAASKPGLENVSGLIAWGESGSHITMKNCINVGTFQDVISLCPMLRNWGSVTTEDCFYLYTGIPLGDERVRTNGALMAEVKGAEDLLVTGDPVCSYGGKSYYSEESELTFTFSGQHEDAFGGYTVSSGTISKPGTQGGTHTIKGFSEQAVTVQAHWGEPVKVTITAGVFDLTNKKCGQGGSYTINAEDMTHTADKHAIQVGEQLHLAAAPAEGYVFAGWYKGKLEKSSDETENEQILVVPTDEIMTKEPVLEFTAETDVILCAVFRDALDVPPNIDLSTLQLTVPENRAADRILTTGDKVNISVKITDADGVKDAVVLLLNPKAGSGDGSGYIVNLTKQENDDIWTGGVEINENMKRGTWCIGFVAARDEKDEESYYVNRDLKDFLGAPDSISTEDFSAFNFEVADSFDVTFDSNGGSEVAPQRVISGHAAIEPDAPAKTGLHFGQWYTNMELTNTYSFDTPVTENLKLYASWNAYMSLGVYNLTNPRSNKQCGTVDIGEHVKDTRTGNYTIPEGNVLLKAKPAKGFAFKGWYTGIVGKSSFVEEPSKTLLEKNQTYSCEAGDAAICAVFECAGHQWEQHIEKATPQTAGSIYQECKYCGTREIIAPLLKVSNIRLESTTFEYTGKAITPKVIVANASEELSQDCYTLTYSNNVKPGTASVKVTLKGKYYTGSKTLNFTIKQKAPIKIHLNRTSLEMAAKQAAQLKVTDRTVADKGLIWKSDNPAVATVDGSGKVTAKARGTATITVISKANSKLSATCKITVKFSDAYYNLDGTGKSCVTKEMETAINWAADKKITGEKVTFGTKNSMTRGQFVRFLHRYAGQPKVTKAMIEKYGSKFKDVNKNYSHYKAIVWAVSKGLISGYDDGTFKPEGTLTRNNVATILWKFAGSPKVANIKKPFTDVAKSASIAWGKSKGIFTGTKFQPSASCLRGDFAVFLYRYDKRK